jgi:hypothetical protein
MDFRTAGHAARQLLAEKKSGCLRSASEPSIES